MPTTPHPPDDHHAEHVQQSGSFRVLVTGSRTWTDTAAVTRALDDLHALHGARLRVVHGACPHGADAIAHTWALNHNVPVEAHPADWATGRAAGPARNAAMVATAPDACLAFIADHSRGASGTADLAETAGIPTTRHETTRQETTSAERARGTADTGSGAGSSQDSRLAGTATAGEGELIAVLDGPLAGQWFTWPDWQERLNASRHVQERSGRRPPALDYVPAGYQIPNPVLAETYGWAAIHQPTTVAAPLADYGVTIRADERAEAHQRTDADARAAADARTAADAQAADDDVFDLAG